MKTKNKQGLSLIRRPLLMATVFVCLLIIAALAIVLNRIDHRLNNLASILEQTAEQHIITDISLDTKLPLNSTFQIGDAITVGINLVVETVIPVNVEIPVNENVLVPFKIGVKDYIRLDTTVMITEDVYANVQDTIYLDQKVTLATSKKRGINLPIRASVPLNQRVKISVDQAIPVHSVVPVELLIIDSLSVGLSMKIPVNLMIPVKIPISTTAQVSFPGSIPVTGEIPIELSIPVDIPLSETAVAPYLRNIAHGLRSLTKFRSEAPNIEKN